MKVVGNLKELIGQAANDYISLNTEDLRSRVPGPKGNDGKQGPIGVSVHHLKGTSTTDDEGDFASAGEVDTYTFYPDADETYPLGWFNVRNGQDAYNYATAAGYAGTEADFYLELAAVREYYEQSQVNADSADEDAQQVAIDAAQVAADRIVVEDAKDVVVAAEAVTVQSAEEVQHIFLGAKASDPTVDNQGNPLVVGVMYYNSISETLRIWNGGEWNLGAFSVAGAVISVNGRDGAVELTKGDVGLTNVDNTSDATKNVLYATTAGSASASDVYTWAKASVKPTYNATEVGLGNVTNESKSTMFANPVFTGIQTGTTASVGDSSTRLATTAFVANEVNKIEEW
jgi:hypothetical protein